ncbi:MAG: GNAT family N-acetyltransferase, partial [Bacteroidota bacterium]
MDIRSIKAEDTWPLRQSIMWPEHPIEFVKLERDTTDGIHLGLFIEEQLVSIISLYINGYDMQFRKFATVVEQQGKGYGSLLLRYVIGMVGPQKGIKKIW